MARATFDVSDEVRSVLRESILDGDRLTLPPRQLERKLYEAVNQVLVAAGGKWDRRLKAHVFASAERAQATLAQAIETGEATNRKTELQAFYTPADVAAQVAELADLRPGLMCLEPSAGCGALIKAANEACSGLSWRAFEIDADCEPSLAALGVETVMADFLSVPTFKSTDRFDRVLMNPPFTAGQDMAHVTHALGSLKQGGILVAIVSNSAGVGTNRAHRRFRDLLDGLDAEVIELPEGAFKSSGTGVRTKVLRIEK